MSVTAEVEIETVEVISYVEAVKCVTSVMMQSLEARSEEPLRGVLPDFPHEARSRIHLISRSPRTLTIYFGPGTGPKMAQKLFCTDEELSSEDIHDAMGEMANMIAGNAKSVLADILKEHIGLGLPLVAWSPEEEGHELESDTVYIPFECELGSFSILVNRGLLD